MSFRIAAGLRYPDILDCGGRSRCVLEALALKRTDICFFLAPLREDTSVRCHSVHADSNCLTPGYPLISLSLSFGPMASERPYRTNAQSKQCCLIVNEKD
ncbi:hypothetical protein VFPFJ_04369 [Purpureocillium lilacinum]|uniref:Uncharacterized protein n=1 Tax=Purpureocillium lilacinum TaxID=33203 RepID=A0A179HL72_PURLI|nr:hypothetical protein VFPFJ_04369 [Purpureocillium lilacinum]OAQ83427.1 hypothetical protein VFPBJ_02195 [Purpureocillium lilacinum]OAQ90210.1 hypothetical protein VFPFJ_04369 [Purpureocillium lilacinum]